MSFKSMTEYQQRQLASVNTRMPPPHTWFRFLEQRDQDARGGNRLHEFPYISYGKESFTNALKPHVKRAKKFIDVGCGGGDKLALAKALWPHLDVYGIEHDPAMAIWASLYGNVFCQDALTHDYSPYDLIYAFWPIANLEKMSQLCHRIVDTKRAEAAFILVGCFGITGHGDYPATTPSAAKLDWHRGSHSAWVR